MLETIKKTFYMQTKNIILAIIALAVGAAAGWFAAGVRIDGASPSQRRGDDGGVVATQNALPQQTPPVAKPKHKTPIRSTADAEVKRRALEKRVRFLEDSIRIANEKKTPKALDATTASNEEIVERLMKLPTEWERDQELQRLGTNRLYTFTIGQLGKLCPKMYGELSREEKEIYYGRLFEKTAERLAILDSVDQSLMTDDEKTLHGEFSDELSHLPELYDEKLYHLDGSIENKTAGEVFGDIEMLVDYQKRRKVLLLKERELLISQAAKHFNIPDDAAAALLTATDDVEKAMVFYRKE